MLSPLPYLLALMIGANATGGGGVTQMVEQYYAGVMAGQVMSYELDIRRLPEIKEGMRVVAVHGEEDRNEPPRGARLIWIKVEEKGRTRDLPVTVQVAPVERVPVASSDIDPRTPITPELISWQAVKTRNFGASHIPSEAELKGLWSKVRIPGGSVLTEKRLDFIPAVVVGQSLKIVLEIGQIEAVAEGRALEDGRIGEKIRVLNLVSGFRLKGRVEGVNQVRVE